MPSLQNGSFKDPLSRHAVKGKHLISLPRDGREAEREKPQVSSNFPQRNPLEPKVRIGPRILKLVSNTPFARHQ